MILSGLKKKVISSSCSYICFIQFLALFMWNKNTEYSEDPKPVYTLSPLYLSAGENIPSFALVNWGKLA